MDSGDLMLVSQFSGETKVFSTGGNPYPAPGQ